MSFALNLDFLRRYRMQVGLLIITAIILILFIATSPKVFLNTQIYLSFLTTVPFVGIMSVGITVVLMCGEIDLSFPSIMAISGFFFATVFTATGSVLLGILASLLSGAVVGMGNGLLVSKIGIPSIVVTLGMMFLIRGLSNVLAGGVALPLSGISEYAAYSALVGSIGVIPVQALWFLVIAVAVWFLMFRHRFGDHVLFIGDNEETAGMMGVNVDRTKILVFMLMGVLAAFAGIIDCMRLTNWWPTMGQGYLMTTLAAAFVGGTSMFGGEGTILGTFVGAFLISSLEAGIVAAGLSGFWTQFIYGLLIILAVTLHTVLRNL